MLDRSEQNGAPGGHDHSACIETALADAEAVCAAKGARLTDLRRKVLALVWESHRAAKAYDLLAALGPDTKPPTVYRALDFLIEHGLVHKLHSLNAFVGCPHPGHGQMARFMICTRCETVQEFQSDALCEALDAATDEQGFMMKGQMIELSGVCAACQSRAG